MLAFPQVILPMADKLGINVPDAARSEPLLQVQAGHSCVQLAYRLRGCCGPVPRLNLKLTYRSDPLTPVHLLSHIYISRSEALWKEPALQSWFERTIPSILPDLMRQDAVLSRADVLRLITTPRDPMDQHMNVPLFICRHVLCSESTSFLGFLPSSITKQSFSAHDPLPPMTATSMYNAEYFAGVRTNKRSRLAARAMGMDNAPAGGMLRNFMEHVYALADANPNDWRALLRDTMNRAMGIAGANAPAEEQAAGDREAVEQMVRTAEEMVAARDRGEDGMAGRDDEAEEEGDVDDMPGAFPQ